MMKLPLLSWVALFPALAFAALEAGDVHPADAKKTNTYLKSGLVVGGSADVKEVIVEDIRRAKNPGFERIVIDLKNALDPEASKNPFYQVSIEPDFKRVVVSIFGRPRAGFDPRKVRQAFAKSGVVSRTELAPSIDPGVWIVTFYLHEIPSAEVFELSSPQRLILDFKTDPRAITRAASPRKAAPRAKALPKATIETKEIHSPIDSSSESGVDPFPDAVD